MWDNAAQLNRLANAIYVLVGMALGYAAVLYVMHLPVFPLREVEVTGEPKHVTYAQVSEIVKRELKGNFFTIDLPQLRGAFEKLPWVRSVNVRRQWPDRLEISLEEHVPLARWGNEGLVNSHGDVFHAAYDGELPVFLGPPGTAKEIAIQFEYFRKVLAPIRRTPVQVQVTPRRAWEVKLAGGTTLALGRDQVEARLARYVEAYDRSVGRLNRRIDYVDLRYTNGFAGRITELKDPPPAGKTAPTKTATGTARAAGGRAPGADHNT
jgi:cell division protein FtsQ